MFLLFRALFISVFVITTAQEFKYQVVAPEFICSQENMSLTAIRLTGEDVQKLKFNWSVSFKVNDTQNLQQRLVLTIWRSVRSLNQVLQNVSKEDINQGIIHINNSMLTPDVQYLINITAHKVDKNKTLTDQKQIAMEYVSKSSKRSTMAAVVKGPEMTYADMPYTAQAEIKSCSDHLNYQLSWQLLDRTRRMVKENKINSRILQIPPGTFASGEEYTIVCSVLDQDNKKDMSNVSLRVHVLERGMRLTTYIKNIKIGPNQPIYLNAYFSDPDCNKGKLVLQWKCRNEAKKECPEFETKNSTELVIAEGFSKPGRYTFTIEASKGKATISASSIVEVLQELVPIIDIENAVTTLNPSDPLKITAHVSRLVEGCTLQWNSLTLDGNPNLDTDKMGESGKVVKITEEEMNSLEEEDKSYNETFADKQHDLVISKTNDLQSGFQYLFRLIASCPCLEITTVASVTKKPDRYVIATADVTIQINSVPILKELRVSPNSGEALRTSYTFQTEIPQNFSVPLLYKYGILTKSNMKMFLVEQYDTTTIKTILPFSDEPIQTVLEVCDSKNACNWTMGSKVIVKIPNNLTLAETDDLLNNFNKSMVEQDYFHAFTLSSMLMQSAQNMAPSNIAQKFDECIKNITRKEIKKFLDLNDSASIYPASNLLKHIKILDKEIQLPQDILSDVLALRDKISERSNSQSKKQSQSEKIRMEPAPGSRKLLSLSPFKKAKRIVNDINIDEIKEYLEISELAIKRLTDFERVETEKQKLRERLQYYLPRICQSLYNNYKTSLRIEMQTVIFEVEKINLNRKYNDYILVPFDIANNARIQLGKEAADKHRNNNGLCIGKILFLEDYFHIPQFVYNVNLYSVHSDNILETEATDFGISIEMPIKSIASNNQMMQCVLWEYDQWDMAKCKTIEEFPGKVKCLCQALGYYSMMPVQRTTTTTTTTIMTTNTASAPGMGPSSQLTVTENSAIVALTTNTYQQTTNHEQNSPQTLTTQTQKPILLTTIESLEQKTSEDYKTASANTEVQSAAVWSISVLSIGIGVLILAFLILLKKTQRSKAVQSFQTIEYARYFDEHNLD